jgi:hypothetical protein
MPDVIVHPAGSVIGFEVLTEAAEVFFEERVQTEPWQYLGSRLYVEARCAHDLVEGLRGYGLDVRIDLF